MKVTNNEQKHQDSTHQIVSNLNNKPSLNVLFNNITRLFCQIKKIVGILKRQINCFYKPINLYVFRQYYRQIFILCEQLFHYYQNQLAQLDLQGQADQISTEKKNTQLSRLQIIKTQDNFLLKSPSINYQLTGDYTSVPDLTVKEPTLYVAPFAQSVDLVKHIKPCPKRLRSSMLTSNTLSLNACVASTASKSSATYFQLPSLDPQKTSNVTSLRMEIMGAIHIIHIIEKCLTLMDHIINQKFVQLIKTDASLLCQIPTTTPVVGENPITKIMPVLSSKITIEKNQTNNELKKTIDQAEPNCSLIPQTESTTTYDKLSQLEQTQLGVTFSADMLQILSHIRRCILRLIEYANHLNNRRHIERIIIYLRRRSTTKYFIELIDQERQKGIRWKR